MGLIFAKDDPPQEALAGTRHGGKAKMLRRMLRRGKEPRWTTVCAHSENSLGWPGNC